MKRELLSLILIGILVLSGLGAVAVSEKKMKTCKTETVLFSQPILSEKEDYITLDVAESTSSSIGKDKPALPVVTKTYTFPFNTHITNVEISYSNFEKEILTKPITPAPEPQILSSTYNSKDIIINEVTETYAGIDIYPEQRISYRFGSGLKDGQRMKFLTVNLYPVQYIPEDNMICYSDSGTIQINYSPSENPVSFPDVYDLLIITPAEFTDELQPLVDYKNENEIPTVMVTLDDIPEKGVDLQEDIKYFIKEAIETWGITYVLLVGSGVEGEEKFPVRYAYCSPFVWWFSPYQVEFPSDLYYADIYNSADDFSSWDYDGDGRYFEHPTDLPAVDIYPDVYLGRLACNNADEVNTVVNKIIDYMEHNKMTNRILQIGGDHHDFNDGICDGEFQNEEVLKKLPGYTTNRLWGSLGNLKKLNIRKGFMDGVDFVDINGHGNSNIIATSPPCDLNTTIPPSSLISPYPGFLSSDYDRFNFNNEKLPVVVYTACLCSRFTDTPNCIGWKPISRSKGGGIASFGYSTYTWGLNGIDGVKRYCGWNEVKIFEEMYNNKILGMCWGNLITEYLNSFNIDALDLTQVPSFTLFGDPTLIIEDGKDPVIKPVDNPSLFPGSIGQDICHFPPLERLFSLITHYNEFFNIATAIHEGETINVNEALENFKKVGNNLNHQIHHQKEKNIVIQPIKPALGTNVWSDNFDSYNLMQFLDGTSDDGGWKILHLYKPEYGAYVVDDQSYSSPHSVKIAGQANIIHEFTGLNSGNLTFRDWIYIPSGSDFGESYIAFLSYHFPDHYLTDIIDSDYYFQVVIKFDLNNGIVINRPYNDTLPLILDKWVELRVEIDLESDWVECFYNDELLLSQKWTHSWFGVNGFLNFACVALLRGYPGEDFAVYHDDMSIYHEGTGLEPDLQCDGSLSFTCKGGETVSDTFTVRNIGDPGSRLEWMIYDTPDYGKDSWWLFDSLIGKLTPEDGEFTVKATLKAPDKIGDYTGVIRIHAIGNASDYCEIPITLTVSKSREIHSQVQLWLEKYPFLVSLLQRFLGL